jgi:Domain of unknown function (DUF4145)
MVSIGDNWKCPYCGHAQVIDAKRFDDADWEEIGVAGEKNGQPLRLAYTAIVCANADCRELSLSIQLGERYRDAGGAPFVLPRRMWTLLPPSSAKPQPDYIPKPIRDDYYEACAIRSLSPKASATLTRRCLQGMIRHFCGISRKRLVDEIDELRQRVAQGSAPPGVQPDSVDAIDNVRKIGNIGAHMEADINVIVDVDPNEAQVLLDLVENLFDEWYVARDAREKRFAAIKAMADEKKQQQQQKAPPDKPLKPAGP